ncbi:MAG: hypothetical protein LH629_07040 [Ignavibacteria bacterium]|nr:hypothetical protein [Ignavibacteria bacterium]
MKAILIKADSRSNKILYRLAKQLGGKAFSINEEQFEDLRLGFMIDKFKKNQLVKKYEILNKLN